MTDQQQNNENEELRISSRITYPEGKTALGRGDEAHIYLKVTGPRAGAPTVPLNARFEVEVDGQLLRGEVTVNLEGTIEQPTFNGELVQAEGTGCFLAFVGSVEDDDAVFKIGRV
jgi:hypothetical protein